MSGSGGGAWPEPTKDPCEKLTSETTLASPDKTVLAKLKKDDVLDIVLNKAGGTPIVQALYKGQVAGSVTSTIIQRIVDCIESGHVYVADVQSVQGGACRVFVHAR